MAGTTRQASQRRTRDIISPLDYYTNSSHPLFILFFFFFLFHHTLTLGTDWKPFSAIHSPTCLGVPDSPPCPTNTLWQSQHCGRQAIPKPFPDHHLLPLSDHNLTPSMSTGPHPITEYVRLRPTPHATSHTIGQRSGQWVQQLLAGRAAHHRWATRHHQKPSLPVLPGHTASGPGLWRSLTYTYSTYRGPYRFI